MRDLLSFVGIQLTTPLKKMHAFGAADAPSASGFGELVLFIVAHQEAMFGEVSYSFAMGAR